MFELKNLPWPQLTGYRRIILASTLSLGSLLWAQCEVDAQGATQPNGANANQVDSKIVVADAAKVILINNVRVPAQVEGMLTEILVEEGAIIEQDQPIAKIDDRQALLTLDLKKAQEREAEYNALNNINLKDAQNSEALAREKAKAYKDLERQGATATWNARSLELEATREKLRIELAEMNMKIAEVQLLAKKSERELADLEIVKRKILAPFSGFVETRVAQLGEWVQPGSPIVQIVQMDRLRAQGFVSAVSPDRAVSPGMPAVVEFDLGNNRKERINGVVGFVGNDVDLQNRRKIWVEFANSRVGNDWLIKPGMIPVIRIDISQPVANSIGQVVTPSSTVR